jgi:hypothetical protein
VCYLCFFTNGLVNDVVIWDDLFLCGEGKILQTGIALLQVDVAQTAVEEDLARVELELEAELLVVDVVVAAQVEQRVVEVCEGLLEVAHEEVGDALLEVGDGEVLVQPHSALVAVDGLFMFAKGGVDDTAVEEDLGRVGDGIEVFQGLVEFIVVVAGEGGDPRLDFLQWWWLAEWRWAWWAWWGSNGKEGRKERTCFSDIVTEKSQQQPPGLEGGATGRQRASNDEARTSRGRNGVVL